MYNKRSKYRLIYIFTAVIFLIAILLPFSGCKPEAVTTTITEKSTVTSTLSKTETKMVTENATVTETKTVTVSPSTTTTTSTTSTATSSTTTSVIANEQEQVIISDDGKIKILKHELIDQYIITPYGVWVSGVVRNIGTETVNVQITVDFYNIDGQYLETKTGTVNNLEPNRSSNFEVVSSDKDRSIHPTKKYVIVGLAAVS